MPAQPIAACPHTFPTDITPRPASAGAAPFTVHAARLGTTALLHLAGEVDMDTEPAARAALARAARHPYDRLALMLADVTFFACCGLNLLTRAQEEAQHHHAALALIAPSAPVLRLLDLTGRTGAFTVHATIADALASATAGPPSRDKPGWS
ncbi:stage II sporulation protein AA (anti-sigma F factor antagonist) [Kitasatospora sp. SolWspMP-SS2h]|uniref:STAS domain-containing protein n=1 Tax=Kitasatospora sp. SolWspMP-SS2h TaxID=1305729 RepID=UPI000DBF60D3|nr:STAS domain-containing protein [Kitasatospora sp. SolWspMP-SS2h]RAJ32812.1 stage II sporulation protein AA (anti-sigma F factor antagonist) [Kitasatospora sp. SolWspMP-SS2h]